MGKTYCFLATNAGFGRHLWDYPIKTLSDSYFRVSRIWRMLLLPWNQHRRYCANIDTFQKVLVVQGLYSPLILIVKLSLFLLYFRVFSQIRRTKRLLYFGIGFNVVFYATSFALILYLCGPGSGPNLRKSFNSHHCVVDSRNLGTVQASFNIFSDLYLLCIPMPVISKLQLSKKKKIGVSAIFMTGFLSVLFYPVILMFRKLTVCLVLWYVAF